MSELKLSFKETILCFNKTTSAIVFYEFYRLYMLSINQVQNPFKHSVSNLGTLLFGQFSTQLLGFFTVVLLH